ncbi:MAG: Gldg family protein [Cellvibrionaceae bacterium]|nr:Gldg family protein [Cellvibrionaceae bacterium]
MQRDKATGALGKIIVKELGQFFRAPIAWLFLSAFLLISLFVFFWVESFFSRNIADVRPLFSWMPLLLIFLSAALTMKMWSEERRSGTLEHVLTQPVPLWQFVVGKFIACWVLLALALLLTLPLPITVSLLGDLDWGPVWSGYVAALLLGGSYISMGLFISSRCDNQIVSLILAVTLAAIFYLIGAGVLTGLFGNQTAEIMRALGTGSRFESITRGVLDMRDLYYYLSLIVAFLALNIFALERGRWASDGNGKLHSIWRWGTALVVANILVANVWLSQVASLRWDTTRGNMYSISSATHGYLAQLQEPILIRGYFTQKTHPLLAPLVPQLQDLLREYEIAGRGNVRVEIVDPTMQPEMEDDANNRFGIKPTPFRVNDRHQAALVNSYFDVLVQYGDQHQVLGFNDLIEVKFRGDTDINVQLRNPEYDITRVIKKVLYEYQSGGDIYASLKAPVELELYISADNRLPPELVELRKAIDKEIEDVKKTAGDKFTVRIIDPDANGGAEGRRIAEEYGFAPLASDLIDPKPFFFYAALGHVDQLIQIPLGDFSVGSFRTGLQAGVKRFAQGFTRTVALVTPSEAGAPQHYGMPMSDKPRFNALREMLSQDLNVVSEDLADGRVEGNVDLLVLAAPDFTDEKQLYAVDQFLMRGGTVIAALSPYSAKIGKSSMTLENYASEFGRWLAGMGVNIGNELVLDSQNSAFPVPTVREVGGRRFNEMRLMDYPYFVDVRGEGLNSDSAVTADLPQVIVPWASPIQLDETKTGGLAVTPLLRSTERAWLGDTTGVVPNATQLQHGYTASGERKSHLLAVALQGKFTSYFAGKDSPLLSASQAGEAEGESAEAKAQPIDAVLNHSADTARLLVFSSTDMFSDQVVNMLSSVYGGNYLSSLQLVVNAVDWSLEDQGLLGIRARGHFNRTLAPMEIGAQQFWEYLNYGLALLGLLILWLVLHYANRARDARYQQWLAA